MCLSFFVDAIAEWTWHAFRSDEVDIRFYSISGSKTTRPTPQPAAARPSMHIFSRLTTSRTATDDARVIQPIVKIVELHIAGRYVIWELAVTRGEFRSVLVEVCDWRAGEVIAVRLPLESSPPPPRLSVAQ